MASPKIKRMLNQALDVMNRQLLLTQKYEDWLALHGGEFVLSEEEAHRFGQLLGDHLARTPRVRSQAFSASARGSCYRAQVFGYIGVPQRMVANSLLALMFMDGKIKHLLWQFIGLEAGALTAIEHPIFPDAFKRWRLKGSIDGADEFNGIGLELKSTRAFNYYCSEGPSMAHRLQIGSYFEGRDDLDIFSLIYWDTSSREWREYVIKREKQYMTMVRNELQALNDAVEDKELPSVQDECKSGKGKTFHDCSYSHICLGCHDYQEAESWVTITPRPESVQSGGGSAARRRTVKRA